MKIVFKTWFKFNLNKTKQTNRESHFKVVWKWKPLNKNKTLTKLYYSFIECSLFKYILFRMTTLKHFLSISRKKKTKYQSGAPNSPNNTHSTFPIKSNPLSFRDDIQKGPQRATLNVVNVRSPDNCINKLQSDSILVSVAKLPFVQGYCTQIELSIFL